MEHFISADEAEIYDRQIRLWGVEAQKRLFVCFKYLIIYLYTISYLFEYKNWFFSLRRASILVIGCRGLGAEVCKDVLLAGVKELTVLDDGELTLEDTCSQMLVTQEQIGKNVRHTTKQSTIVAPSWHFSSFHQPFFPTLSLRAYNLLACLLSRIFGFHSTTSIKTSHCCLIHKFHLENIIIFKT